MTDYFWPTDIIPSQVRWSIRDSTAVFTSALSGVTRTVSRPGIAWGCSITLPPTKDADRHRVMALLSALRGRENRIWLPDFAQGIRGSFPASELIGNTTFGSTSGWTSSNAELVLTADSGRLRLTRTGATADRYASASCSTSSGAQYLFRAGILAGRGTPTHSLNIGTSAGGTQLVAGSQQTTAGYRYVTAAASGSTSYPAIRDYSSGKSADLFMLADSPSFARCALVNGASQSGGALQIDGLPNSTDGLLRAGDWVAVYTTTWELKRLRADLNSNGSGQGTILFDPPLRSSPADNSPVAIHNPMARFLLATDTVSWDTGEGRFSSFNVEFVEDIT